MTFLQAAISRLADCIVLFGGSGHPEMVVMLPMMVNDDEMMAVWMPGVRALSAVLTPPGRTVSYSERRCGRF